MTQLVLMIAAFLALTGLVLLLVNLTGVNAGEGAFLSASLIIAVLYLSGKILGSFRIGEWTLLVLAVAGVVLSVVKAIRKASLKGPSESSSKGSSKPSSKASPESSSKASSESSLKGSLKSSSKGFPKTSLAGKPSGNAFASLLSPAFIVLLIVFFYVLVAFYGVFLHHIDEFHLWGPIARDMARNDALPDWSVYGIPQMYGTSFFQLFFLKITGYSEQVLYGASFLMAWIGFLLPVSSYQRKDSKKVWLYSLIVFVSIYSLYLYNYKAIYVDLVCASWAGGLAAWWFVSRQKAVKTSVKGANPAEDAIDGNDNNRRSRLLVLCTGLVMICFLKSYVGILMSVLILLFILFEKMGAKLACGSEAGNVFGDFSKDSSWNVAGDSSMDSSGNVSGDSCFAMTLSVAEKKFYGFLLAISAVILAVYGAMMLVICKGMIPSFFPASVKLLMNDSEVSLNKAVRTAGALANAFLGEPLSGHSRLEVYPLAAIVVVLIWLIVTGWVYRDEVTSRIRRCYVVVSCMLYLMFIMAAFVCMFSYNEAIRVAGIKRYFSVYIIYLFVICLVMWIRKDILPGRSRTVMLGCFALLIVFVFGINDRFMSDATAFNEYQLAGSEDIQAAASQSKKIAKEIGEGDKVYFLNQSTDNEYPQNVAYYYLGSRVSNYLTEPWRFTKDGCEVRIQEYETPTIKDLPAILAENEYTYVWIYDGDEYLAREMGKVFCQDDLTDSMTDGQLYKVTYDNGTAIGLELAKQLDKEAVPVMEESEEEEDAA